MNLKKLILNIVRVIILMIQQMLMNMLMLIGFYWSKNLTENYAKRFQFITFYTKKLWMQNHFVQVQ